MSSNSSNTGPLSSDSGVGHRQNGHKHDNNNNSKLSISPKQRVAQLNGKCHEINGNAYDDSMDDSGYLALDQLLASLALENDIMERQLSQINNNETASITFKTNKAYQINGTIPYDSTTGTTSPAAPTPTTSTNTMSECLRHSNSADNLNDVLANLIEFSETEQQQQQLGSHCYANGILTNGTQSHQHTSNTITNATDTNHIFNYSNQINGTNIINPTQYNNNHNPYHTTNGLNGHPFTVNHINQRHFIYHEPNHVTIKRLTSESENSSSISPSLSERSNGVVSWSDQVKL